MGLTLTKASCPYGMKGVQVDSTNVFEGFVLTTGECVLYDQIQEKNNQSKTIFVTPCEFICAISIERDLETGAAVMTLTDTIGKTFSCLFSIRSSSSQRFPYSTSIHSENNNQIITSVGLDYNSTGNPIFINQKFGNKPNWNVMPFTKCIGWIEDITQEKGLLGFISADNQWQLLRSHGNMVQNNHNPYLKGFYFKKGFLLAGIEIERQNENAKFVFVASDSCNRKRKYHSFQTICSPFYLKFDYQREIEGLSIQTLTYLTFDSANAHSHCHAEDYLIIDSTLDEFQKPQTLAYYGPEAKERICVEKRERLEINLEIPVTITVCVGFALILYLLYRLYLVLNNPDKTE